MTDLNLPDELAAFEAELQALPRAQMPSTLRERVLADLQAELSSPTAAPGMHCTPNNLAARWWFAACAALVAMVWLNLSLVAARSVGDSWQQAEASHSAKDLIHAQEAVALLAPELSPADAGRYAVTLSAGTQTTFLPIPGTGTSANPFGENP